MPIILVALFAIVVLMFFLYFKLKNSTSFRSWFFQLTECDEDISSEEAIAQAEKAREGVSQKKAEALVRMKELEREKKALQAYLGEPEEISGSKREEEGPTPKNEDD